jgi:hypothetical protein
MHPYTDYNPEGIVVDTSFVCGRSPPEESCRRPRRGRRYSEAGPTHRPPPDLRYYGSMPRRPPEPCCCDPPDWYYPAVPFPDGYPMEFRPGRGYGSIPGLPTGPARPRRRMESESEEEIIMAAPLDDYRCSCEHLPNGDYRQLKEVSFQIISLLRLSSSLLIESEHSYSICNNLNNNMTRHGGVVSSMGSHLEISTS